MVDEVYPTTKSVSLHDLCQALCRQQCHVFMYKLDPSVHFWLRMNHAYLLFDAQSFYLQQCPRMQATPVSMEQVIQPCYVHPSAEIHPTAVIGPNVMIGAEVVIKEGARIVNSIVLEDVTI